MAVPKRREAPWALAALVRAVEQAAADWDGGDWPRDVCPACYGPLVEFKAGSRVRACGTPNCPVVFAEPTSGVAA